MNNQNIWPHVIVTVAIIAFCTFMVWRMPSAFSNTMLIIGGLVGWWMPSPNQQK